MTQMRISISRLHYPVTTLGPGRRVGIWFQGCSIRCEGCISADTWGFEKGATTVEAVLETVAPWISVAGGVTISGGEPFDQPEALQALVRGLHLRADQGLLVYSGYPLERIRGTLDELDGLVDAVISDPFELSAPQTLALRGSDNQRLNLLTKVGQQQFEEFDRPLAETERSLDVMFDDAGTVWLAGVPRRGDMLRLRDLLRAQGHEVATTDATRTAE